MKRKTKERPMKLTYHYIEPKTPQEKEAAERRLNAAYDILFEATLESKGKKHNEPITQGRDKITG